MNYRHIYHAGNFADVLKHAVLTLVIGHLKQKAAPFRVIDTHAGIGSYDLTSLEAQKTGEWISGIGRLLDAPLPRQCAAILAPYLDLVRQANPDGGLTSYPGSPLIARRMLRRDDRLVVNELHGEDHARLAELFARDPQTKVLHLDGWIALKSLLPPKERRGAVLIDPPFEEPGELDRLAHGLMDALRRFATGTYLLWYPIKDTRAVRNFHDAIRRQQHAKAMACQLLVRAPDDPSLLNGTGLVIINPPYTLHAQLDTVLPVLANLMALGAGGGFELLDLSAASAGRQPTRENGRN